MAKRRKKKKGKKKKAKKEEDKLDLFWNSALLAHKGGRFFMV